MPSKPDYSVWYASVQPTYERLAATIRSILDQLLSARSIDFLAVTSRTKSFRSFADKLKRKSYKDPATEVTDLAGIRVVTYLESDVQRVAALSREIFRVDESHTVDKAAELAVDRLGYRSVHLICSLGRKRDVLPEYSEFKGLRFEIQIRSVLQHAWAQIEHDRSYKFGGVLPDELKRRLNLAAGSLESVDREFDKIAAEIDEYAAKIGKQAAGGDLDIPINSPSMWTFLKLRGAKLRKTKFAPSKEIHGHADLIKELRAFGVRTLAALDQLLNPDFLAARDNFPDDTGTTEFGLLRDAMMYKDIDRYFERAHKGKAWGRLDEPTYNMLADRFGGAKVDQIMSQYDVDLEDQD